MSVDVPIRAHWIVTTFRRVARVSEGLVDPTDPSYSSMRLIAPNHIESGTGRLQGVQSAEEQGADSGKYLANEGEILYSKIRPQLNKVAIAPEPCLCSADMYPIRLRSGDVRFAVYWMLAKPFLNYASTMADRVKMPKINREELAGAPWVAPPEHEQRAIADFLDRETTKIDDLIEKQNNLVSLLRERRLATVDAAFSPLGQSRRLRVRDLLRVRPSYGVLVPRYVDEEGPETVRLVRVGDLSDLDSKPVLLPLISREQSAEYSRTQLRGGEVLLGVVGKMGQAAVAPDSLAGANVARAVAVLRCRDAPTARLLCLWLSTTHFLHRALLATGGDTIQPTLGMADLARFEIAWPDGEDGPRSALDHVERETARIDALIAKAGEFIALARERRAALITAAVTGQIDVTEGAS